jgi:hypothetical protein
MHTYTVSLEVEHSPHTVYKEDKMLDLLLYI